MRFILILLMLISTSACFFSNSETKYRKFSGEAESSIDDSITPLPKHDLSAFPDIATETEISKILKWMKSADCVYSSGIGFVEEYTRVYASFERLCQLSTGEQLLALLKTEKDPVIKAFCLQGLKGNEKTLFEAGRNLLLKDDRAVCMFSGCIKSTISLSLYASFVKHNSDSANKDSL